MIIKRVPIKFIGQVGYILTMIFKEVIYWGRRLTCPTLAMTYTLKVSNFQQNQLEKPFWKGSSLTSYLTMVCFVVHQILLFTQCGKGWTPITYWNCLHDFFACLESGNSQGVSLLLVSSSRPREAIYNLFNSLTQSMMDGWQYDGYCNWLVWGWGGGRKEGIKRRHRTPLCSLIA